MEITWDGRRVCVDAASSLAGAVWKLRDWRERELLDYQGTSKYVISKDRSPS